MGVRTRFAPSPTGSLHVGSVRTALFSWLFAKHHHGEFVLRIEDTDQDRSTQESVAAIIEGMQWLGLSYDEGPIRQTARYPRYQAMLERLLDEGKAYRCYCSKERLEALRDEQMRIKVKPRYDGTCRNLPAGHGHGPYVVRIKTPESGMTSFEDQVYGRIDVNHQELDDLILMRQDQHPTYNFAVVVDDWDMHITHVIRGDDHINNTPRQIHIYQALGAPLPVFAHLPMILGADGKRLSKRHGAVSVLQFKEMGILPHALLNYLVRLGWSHGDQEIFSLAEMIQYFDLDKISRGVSSFNYEKLYWLNQNYQKTDPAERVAAALRYHFDQQGIDISRGPGLVDLVKVQAERCKTLVEICEKSQYFYQNSLVYDEDAVKKHLTPSIAPSLQMLFDHLQTLSDWQEAAIHACIQEVCSACDLSMGKLAQPVRVAVTGGVVSPAIATTLVLLGQALVLNRLGHALQLINYRQS